MGERLGIFSGDDPFVIARRWLEEASATEPSDPDAIALSTVDSDGLPDVRMVLLKEIEQDAFVFYTNFESTKAMQIEKDGRDTGKAAFVMHWKSLARQIRVRGLVSREDGEKADAYYRSRALQSRLGAWASRQSQPLASREALLAEVERVAAERGTDPDRPPFWGGFRIRPLQIEFWADGAFRLHDRFLWSRKNVNEPFDISRLSP